tara:strand:- start:319 stop:1005 length:687 start_codon:yes stop_codon:yes gene_type:complete
METKYEAFAPYGPLIYRADIRGEFNDFLLEGLSEFRSKEYDARSKLVGNIENQRYSPYNPKKFIKFIDPHILNYINERYERTLCIHRNTFGNEKNNYLDPKKCAIKYHLGEGPWINFTTNGEFNPMHNHTGVMSSVIFIDIPDEINIERETSGFQAKAAGCLDLISQDQHIVVRPVSGTMYLFPAHLWHLVYPYHSDVERISMSFNVWDVFLNDEKYNCSNLNHSNYE